VSEIEERQRQRDDYLVALYNLSKGKTLQWATHRQIAEASGIPEGDIFDVGQLLMEQRLCEFKTMAGLDGSVAITARGIQQAERLIRERESAGLVLTDQQLLQRLEPLLSVVRTTLDENGDQIDPDLRADLRSDMESAASQTVATHPNRGVIAAALGRLKENWLKITLGVATIAPDVDLILHGLGVVH